MTKKLISEYGKKKRAIKKRLRDFSFIKSRPEKRLFTELCFCICTPQSKAVYCDKAISELAKSGVLFKGNTRQVRAALKAVRFPNNKARYIVQARRLFIERGALRIKKHICACSNIEARFWLVRNVKGIGFKEASHFLRNIGLGRDIAILDIHILRNLKRYGVIDSIPQAMSKKEYLKIEDKTRIFSRKIGIPIEELDLLFWSSQTGFIFK